MEPRAFTDPVTGLLWFPGVVGSTATPEPAAEIPLGKPPSYSNSNSQISRPHCSTESHNTARNTLPGLLAWPRHDG